MRIVVLCEGRTEQALKRGIHDFVNSRMSGGEKVGVDTRSFDGPTVRRKLARIVELSLTREDTTGVIALTDVYPDFSNAAEAKAALQRFAGNAGKNRRFRAHAAQFDIQASLMPFWDDIAGQLEVRAGHPGANPEEINNQRPPSHHIKELYRRAKQHYEKVIDAPKWLTGERLERAAGRCPELKSFLDSLLEFAGADRLK